MADKVIGESFESELRAAGILGGAFSWNPEGELFFGEDVSLELRNQVMNVLGSHDPSKPAPPPVPQVVSRFQGREAMWQTLHGDTTLFEAAEAVLADPDTPAMYRRAWDDLQEFRRDSEMLAAIAGMLGLTAAQIDALFILAASIQA
jgi:hypothetical protein